MFWFFGSKSCGVLPPRPGIESTLPALEGDVLTIGSLRGTLKVLLETVLPLD